MDEAMQSALEEVGRIPLALEVAVANPLKLALFMTGLRAFVDGTAPGMTEWKERSVGERRFVAITSPMEDDAVLLYATTPTALILSLDEATLLAAMAREEARRTGGGAESAAGTEARVDPQAALELRGNGVKLLEVLLGKEVSQALRQEAWRNLPILDEWHRLHPELDPVTLHERVFGERLVCPGGGAYAWNSEGLTMESTVFGHPGAPKSGVRWPRAWDDLDAARFELAFEHDGLRVRLEIDRE